MPTVADPDLTAEWWTVHEVAAYLGVARNTVHAYRSRSQMPEPDQRYGKTDMWRPATITAWHATRSAQSRQRVD